MDFSLTKVEKKVQILYNYNIENKNQEGLYWLRPWKISSVNCYQLLIYSLTIYFEVIIIKKIKWGILGPGTIAKKFARGINFLEDVELFAVGSRSQERADKFAKEFGAVRSYGDYETLVDDPEVDVIYVATPHIFHKEHTLLCLQAGKSVLCEKPFAINAIEASEMIDCAHRHKKFLMEAMWTRFLPTISRIKRLLSDEIIGEIRMVKADFGFRIGWDPENRLLNKELGGGALLDVGIYTISFASMILGKKPEKVKSISYIGQTGVDEQTAVILGYEGGELAQLTSAVRTNSTHDAWILGTEGRIHINNFWHAEKATINVYDKKEKEIEIEIPIESSGYNYEIKEVNNCIRKGQLESKVMPLSESLAIMETMDKIRDEIGLRYSVDQ